MKEKHSGIETTIIFVPRKDCMDIFTKALDKFNGVFSVEMNPRDLRRVGKIVITLYGDPKDE